MSSRGGDQPAARTTVCAHAKVNLELRVTAIRADGFHDLETVFQSIALHDVLHVERRPGPFALACDTPGVPLGAANLVWRAAEALWLRLGRRGAPEGASVWLEKRIPMQAGLGGGSADAAAALVGLAHAWDAEPALETLAPIAAGLGSDVAFCLVGGTALGTGRGDRLTALPDLPHHWVVLATPGFGVSTADAYRWFDEGPHPAQPAGSRLDSSWRLGLGAIRNDLERAVAARHPEIDAMREALLARGARVAGLSGSGSTVFGLFSERAVASRAAVELARACAGAAVVLTETRARGG